MKGDIRIVSITGSDLTGTVALIGKLQSGSVNFNPGDIVTITDESQPGVIAEALAEHLPTLQADLQPPEENAAPQLNAPTPNANRW